MKTTFKTFFLASVFLLILAVPVKNAKAQCDLCRTIGPDNLQKFKSCILPKCPAIKLDQTITINEPLTIDYTTQPQALVIYSDNRRLIIDAPSLNRVDFKNVVMNIPIFVGGGSVFFEKTQFNNELELAKSNLDTENSTNVKLVGVSNSVFNKVVIIRGGVGLVSFSLSEFNLPLNAKTALFFDMFGFGNLVGINSNKYIYETGVSELSKLFEIEGRENYSRPEIEYAGFDGALFKLKVKNTFIDADDKHFWGTPEVRCGSLSLNPSGSNHIMFELYYVKYSDAGNKIVSLYPIKKYSLNNDSEVIAISKDVDIDVSVHDDPRGSVKLKGGDKVALLVNCRGAGTPQFSEPITLITCPEGQTHNGSVCVEARICQDNEGCLAGKVCRGGQCIVPECTVDNMCGPDEVCTDYECIAKPAPVCAADADCGQDFYCHPEGKVCAKCSDIADSLSSQMGICPDHSFKLPSCGNICICKTGYVSFEGKCIAVEPSTCPEGEEYNPETKECFKPGITPPQTPAGGKGGCSLIRE